MHDILLGLTRFLIDLGLKLTALLALVSVALLALSRTAARTRHRVAIAGLALALLLPMLTVLLPRWNLPLLAPVQSVGRDVDASDAPMSSALRTWLSLPPEDLDFAPANSDADIDVDADADAPVIIDSSGDANPSVVTVANLQGTTRAPRHSLWAPVRHPFFASDWTLSWALIFFALCTWALVQLGVLLRLAWGVTQAWRWVDHARPAGIEWSEGWARAKQAMGLKRPTELKLSDEVRVALTLGHLDPVVLLPNEAKGWSSERRHFVLLHELAHVLRRDWLALLLSELALACYWFHPLTWFVVSTLRRDTEQAADDLVLRTGARPSDYAAHLLDMVRALRVEGVDAAVPMARKNGFEQRMRAILQERGGERSHLVGPLAALTLAGCALLLAVVHPIHAIGAPGTGAVATLPAPAPVHAMKSTSAMPSVVIVSPATPKQAQKAAPNQNSPSAPVQAAPSSPAPCSHNHVSPHAAAYGLDPSSELVPAQPPAKSSVVAQRPSQIRTETQTQTQTRTVVRTQTETETLTETDPFVPLAPLAPFAPVRTIVASRDAADFDWYARGMELHYAGNYREAIAAFEKAVQAGEREAAASYNVACGHALLGEKDAAMEWLQRSLSLGMDLSEYLENDDDLALLRSDPRFRKLSEDLRNDPNSAQHQTAMKARVLYEHVQHAAPSDPEVWFKAGKELFAAGEFSLAAQAYGESAVRNEKPGSALYNQACSYARIDAREDAFGALSLAIEGGFNDPQLMAKDDDLESLHGDARFAPLLRDAQTLFLPSRDSHNSLWQFFHKSESVDWKQAIERYQNYANTNPRSGRAHYNLGYAWLAVNEPQKAADEFRRSLDLGYRKSCTLYNLACCEARLGHKDQAFEELQRAQESGFSEFELFQSDEDLDNLRDDPRFQALVKLSGHSH
jgi:beta-lactamase regulating signal transducer with metallopeptidase domain/Flp pilus assembly protein TadD